MIQESIATHTLASMASSGVNSLAVHMLTLRVSGRQQPVRGSGECPVCHKHLPRKLSTHIHGSHPPPGEGPVGMVLGVDGEWELLNCSQARCMMARSLRTCRIADGRCCNCWCMMVLLWTCLRKALLNRVTSAFALMTPSLQMTACKSLALLIGRMPAVILSRHSLASDSARNH